MYLADVSRERAAPPHLCGPALSATPDRKRGVTAMTNLEELKTKQQKMWSSGDYGKIAWITVPLADQLCDSIQLRPGSTVLDVATGTGHVALAAARRFCHTTGIDFVPALVETAKVRAAAEGLDINFRTADAENLPFPDGSFDFVTSAIGVMFTADHERAARELARVCRPGGRIGLANWTPSGFLGQLFKTVGKYVPPPPGVKPPTRWGSEDGIRELLGDQSSELHLSTATVRQRFLSPEHFADFFLTEYGPTLKASEQLPDDGKQAFRADLIAIANDGNLVDDGTLVCDWEYLVAVATRR
jgi:SAM-dependent methyltransferase